MQYVILPTTKERKDRLKVCLESLYENAGMAFTLCIYENEPRGAVVAMHEMIEGINGLVWWIQDDILIGKDCLKILAENHKGGVSVPNDGITKGELATLPFCHTDILKEFYFNGYKHNWADVEFTKVMQKRGEYHYIPEAKCEHQHWINNKAQVDETYKKAASMDSEDKLLFNSRKHIYD